MKIGLTFNLRPESITFGICGDDEFVEWDTPETISYLEKVLAELGHQVIRIGNCQDLIVFLATGGRADFVFNIAEGQLFQSREAQVPAILDSFGLPYTFSDPLTMGMCLNKWITKIVLKACNVPTPAGVLIAHPTELECIAPMNTPVFVKPVHEGTSKGIDLGAVVHNAKELRSRVDFVTSTYRESALVEQYIQGNEYTVGIVGTGDRAHVIGACKIAVPAASVGVYGVHEKEYCEDMVTYQVIDVEDAISRLALRAYKALGCRDAGRIDVIVSPENDVYVLEVNPLPGLHPTHADLPIIATGKGIIYRDLIAMIMSSAIERQNLDQLCAERHWSSAVSGVTL